MKYQGRNPLGQEVFHNQPPEVDWAGVDYDGELHFGKAINPRVTWASECWRGFQQIGESVENSGYEPLASVRRVAENGPNDKPIMVSMSVLQIALDALNAMADPVTYMESKLAEGEKLDGLYAIRAASSSQFYQDLAKIALAKIDEKLK